MKHKAERRTWKAMIKFANDEPLTKKEWYDLSCLTMIDRTRLAFEPRNVRWATTEAERVGMACRN